MVKNVFCFIGVTAWCRQKSWERSDSPIRIESQSQAEVQSGGGGLKNFGSTAGGEVVASVPVVINTDVPQLITPTIIATDIEMVDFPEPTIIVITPTNQPLPDIPIPNTPVIPVPTVQPTKAPLVEGYDIEGFTSMCLAMGSGYVVERQGDIWVCHCPGCP